jgi:arabinan endo-1,5-alpha-L-arabinosidase
MNKPIFLALAAWLLGNISLSNAVAADWQLAEGATVSQGKRVYVRGQGYYTDNLIDGIDLNAQQPLRLVVSQSSFTVTNADGTDAGGRPYFNLSAQQNPLRIYFAAGRGAFSYQAAVYQQSSEQSLPDPVLTEPVQFTEATVHDPSVIRLQSGEFYVFGSHLAAAKSPDLLNWQRFAEGVNDDNPLFATYQLEAADGIAWSGGHIGSWAADVIQLADGKFYFYYNHCASPENGECDSSRSYLGLAVADDIEGPYQNLGLLLTSGHRGSENPGIDGNTYDGNIHPNAIDPDVFFDKTGRLWMVYGSYSGGIWIMELDTQSGFPLPDQGYGTKLMGGYFSAIEGPFMLYSPQTDYYYLFTSFGGFIQNDGYNMRIARSRSPQGPFVDAQGQDMLGAAGGWSSIAPYGVKLMGGHLFDAHPGDPGSDHGYMAPGHNSAYYDAETGQHFLIFHTRFPHLGEGHQIRVHQLFVNSDDWLVASPHRYAPISGENVVDSGDVQGTYQFIRHGKDINRAAHKSVYLTLAAGGVVSGAYQGEYSLTGHNQISLQLDDGSRFNGVLAWQYNDNTGQLVPTFSALSEQGEAVWGSRLPAMSDADLLQAVAAALQLPASSSANLELPLLGAQGTTISWQSSAADIISNSGRVERPAVGQPDAIVTLTATISIDGNSLQQQFQVSVPARAAFNRIGWYRFEQDLSDSTGRQGSGQATGDRLDNSGEIEFSPGQLGNALVLNGNNGVRLPDALIQSADYTVSLWLQPQQLVPFSTAFFAASSPDNWLSLVPRSWDDNTMLWSGSQAWYDASTGLQIAPQQWTHLAFSRNQGQVRVYVNGEQRFSGSNFPDLFSTSQATFALGVNYWDLPLQGMLDELAIYDSALSQTEIRALDIEHWADADMLQAAVAELNLGDISAVRDNLSLPRSGAFAADISWQSSDNSIIAPDGTVTRPGAAQNDAEVTLTATVKLNGLLQSRDFVVTVRSLAPPQSVAYFSFDQANLQDNSGNFGAGSSTGSTLDQAGGSLSYQPGISGQALVLDGSSGVRLPDNLLQDHSYSIALWLKPQQLTSFSSVFFGYADLDRWLSLVPRGHAGVAENTMLWSGTAWYDAGIGQQIALHSWSHLAVVVDNGNVSVYLNGELKFSNTGFPDLFSGAGSNGFALGVNFWDLPFNGLVDEVRLYDDAIAAEEVQQLSHLE